MSERTLTEAERPALGEAPDPATVRGLCPICAAPVISECREVGEGFRVTWRCWRGIQTGEPCFEREL